MTKDMVTVIIPVFNNKNTLRRCLNSIKDQTYNNLEIICINDGSVDDSLEILTEYSKSDSRFKIISKQNAGVSAARNDAITKSAGDYILFVDADDYISPDYIKNLYNCVSKGNDIAVCGYTEINTSGILKINDYKFARSKEDYLKYCIQNTGGVVCSKIYRAELVKSNKIYFDTKLTLSEDLIFSLSLFLKAENISKVDNYGYFYDRTNETHKNRDVIKQLEKGFKVQDKINDIFSDYTFLWVDEVLNNRISAIVYSTLYNLTKNGEYKKFKNIRLIFDKKITEMDFLSRDLLNKLWINEYIKKHFISAYFLLKLRIFVSNIIH